MLSQIIFLLPLLLSAQASTLGRLDHGLNPDFEIEMPNEPNADLWNDVLDPNSVDAWNNDSPYPGFVNTRNDGGSNLDFEEKFDARGLNLSSMDYQRVIGGQDAPQDAFPHMGSMQIGGQHFCGCSIIHQWVCLTAAHCLMGWNDNDLNQMYIVVGSITLNPSGFRHPVYWYRAHERFDQTTLINDIGVVAVRQPFRWSRSVRPIQLYNSDIPVGTVVWLSGWGYISYPNPTTSPNTLQYIGFRKTSMTECRRIYQLWETGQVLNDRTQMCVFNDLGRAGCKGDSGGPLVVKAVVKGTDQLLQVGVVSWGNPCAKGTPDIYTKVAAYIDWIRAVIQAYKLRNSMSENLLDNGTM